MFLTRNTFSLRASKLIFSVICLSLLTAQFSYKYYQLASSISLKAAFRSNSSHSESLSFGFSIQKQDKKVQYRWIDKRFDAAHDYLLPETIWSVELWAKGKGLIVTPLFSQIPQVENFTAFLRGPPFFAA